MIMTENIKKYVKAECPWRDTLLWHPSIDSTNREAKDLAKAGAAHGTVVLAGSQSAGKGRMGRSFSSPEGKGVYLSAILRPGCRPEQLMHLTCAVAVAVCDAIEQAAGIRPGIKWINDLVLEGKKLGGILTELAIDSRTGLADYAIVGIGINCCGSLEDFPAELRAIATSLQTVTGTAADPARVAAAIIEKLWEMELFTQKEQIMSRYKTSCITLGKEIQLLRAGQIRCGKAIDLDENGCLIVEFSDGKREIIGSGEASIRGMYGYI